MKNGLTFPSSLSFLSQLPLHKALNNTAPNSAVSLVTGKVRKYVHMFLVLSKIQAELNTTVSTVYNHIYLTV